MAGVAQHQKSTLPSPTSLAHAIRYDGQSCTSLARELGCSDKRISDHLRAGGFDGHGDPVEHTAGGPRPRLKDSDTGSANFVSGGDRPISTDPVQYGRTPSHAREGFDWGSLGPPPKPPPGKREVFPEPDPDAYVEPPTLGEEWDPDAQSTVHDEDQDLAELEETAHAPQMRSDEQHISNVETRNDVSSGQRVTPEPDDLVQQVRHLYLEEKLSRDGVAATLGISTNRVHRICQQHNILRPPAPAGPGISRRAKDDAHRPRQKSKLEQHAQTIIARYKAGESATAIAGDYGASHTAVHSLLKRHEVPRRTAAEAARLARGSHSVQPAGGIPAQIQARREALLTDLARPRRASQRTNAPLSGTSDDSQVSDSGKNPSEIEPTPDVDRHTPCVDDTDSEAADAQQMQPVDTNEGSNDDANATPEPEPEPEQGSKQVSKPLASEFEPSNEPAGAASRAKPTGHTHGNGGTCHSLHARQFDATAALLLRAKQSQRKRNQALGERINNLLIDLRDRLDDEDSARREKAEAQRRREEERAAAKAEVKRLEKELRDAKARARRHNKGYSRTPDVQHRTPDVRGDDAGTRALDQSRGYQRELLARHGVRLGEVRTWALEQGIDCPAKGSRLPRPVLDAYDAAHTRRTS